MQLKVLAKWSLARAIVLHFPSFYCIYALHCWRIHFRDLIKQQSANGSIKGQKRSNILTIIDCVFNPNGHGFGSRPNTQML